MWDELLLEAGLNEREVRSIMILGSRPKMKASELAKELNTTRLDAYNSLSRLQEMGIVTATADRPMLFSSLRINCLLYTSPSPRDGILSRMPSSA